MGVGWNQEIEFLGNGLSFFLEFEGIKKNMM